MKRIDIFVICALIGSLLGFYLGFKLTDLWSKGGDTFWVPIDYFPFPVDKILVLESSGNEFWVETTDSSIYHIGYPCQEGATCWQRINIIPNVAISNKYIVNNKCKNDYFVYPLFHKIKMCVTSTVTKPGLSIKAVSLALTNNHKLWVWRKPSYNPYDAWAIFILLVTGGSAIGFFAGVFTWKMIEWRS